MNDDCHQGQLGSLKRNDRELHKAAAVFLTGTNDCLMELAGAEQEWGDLHVLLLPRCLAVPQLSMPPIIRSLRMLHAARRVIDFNYDFREYERRNLVGEALELSCCFTVKWSRLCICK